MLKHSQGGARLRINDRSITFQFVYPRPAWPRVCLPQKNRSRNCPFDDDSSACGESVGGAVYARLKARKSSGRHFHNPLSSTLPSHLYERGQHKTRPWRSRSFCETRRRVREGAKSCHTITRNAHGSCRWQRSRGRYPRSALASQDKGTRKTEGSG